MSCNTSLKPSSIPHLLICILCVFFSYICMSHFYLICFTPHQSLFLFNTTAVTLITILRDQQGKTESLSESTSTQPEQDSPQSQRIVLLSKNRQGQISEVPETNLTIDIIKSTRRLENTSPEPSLPSENHSSSLDGYTGTEPLIGEHKQIYKGLPIVARLNTIFTSIFTSHVSSSCYSLNLAIHAKTASINTHCCL